MFVYALMRQVSICALCPVERSRYSAAPRPQDARLLFFFNYENWIFVCDTHVLLYSPPPPHPHSAANRQRPLVGLSVCRSAACFILITFGFVSCAILFFFWGRHLIELTATGKSFLPSSDSFLSPLSALQNPGALMKLG